MLTHIVLFRLKNPSLATIEEARMRILGMQGKIPLLLHLEVGVDILHSDRSYDIALVSKFNSLEDMQAYQVHLAHLEVAMYMAAISEKSVTVDYEVQ